VVKAGYLCINESKRWKLDLEENTLRLVDSKNFISASSFRIFPNILKGGAWFLKETVCIFIL